MNTAHDITNEIAEVSLVYKASSCLIDAPIIDDPEKSFKVLMHFWDMNRIDLLEEFKVILLNRANKVLGIAPISTGGISACVVDPRIIFATALKANASGIIMAHNHPSGNLNPSKADINITTNIVAAGKLLEIAVFDHIIVTSNGCTSMAKNGFIP